MNVDDIYKFFQSSVDTNAREFSLPHKTDLKSLRWVFSRNSYIPLGIFHEGNLIGYSLVRLLFPKLASYAIFVARDWQGRGIGTAALGKQLDFINQIGFNPSSAVNKANVKSLRMLQKLNIEFAKDCGNHFFVKNMRGNTDQRSAHEPHVL